MLAHSSILTYILHYFIARTLYVGIFGAGKVPLWLVVVAAGGLLWLVFKGHRRWRR